MSMKRLRFAFVAVLVVLASLAVAACGSDDKDSSSSGSSTTKSVPTGQKGGTVTALSAGDVDYMDPGQTYYTFGYQVAYSVNRALYYFSPEDSSKQIPDIADGEPEIAEDGKSMTIKLKEGIKFSPAGQPRGQVRRHQVRLRARRSARTSRTRTRRSTSVTSSARRRSRPRASRTSRASPARTTRRSTSR